MLQTIKFLYLPFFLLLGNGLAIYWMEQAKSKEWLFILVGGFIALSFLLERISPYDRAFNVPQGDVGRDVVHAMVNESMSVIGLMLMPLTAGLITVAPLWPDFLPLWIQLVIAIVVADVGITLTHFASHRFVSLWRLHAVHHSVKRMYGFNGLMKHPLHQAIETTAGVTPLLLIGVSQEVLVLLTVAVILQLLVQHSNVSYFVGPLKNILVTNQVHRFHHLNNAEEGDVNFGLFTTFTDYMLGTLYYDPDRTIGMESLGISTEPNYPATYRDQLLKPFQK